MTAGTIDIGRIGRAWLLSPRLLRGFIPGIVALAAALTATLAVDYVAFLTFANRFLGDWETAALLTPEPQSADIVVVSITEDTLKQFPYRSPIDRQFLSDLLKTLASKGPRAIGLDILLDQATEAEKDESLRQTMHDLPVPLVVSYTDSAEFVDDEQRKFLDDFVPPADRALATLATDQFDTVRWTYPGQPLANGGYLNGFARALAAAVGVDSPAKLVNIAWHGQPARDVPAFRQYPAHLVAALWPEVFKNKIVLIGTDLTLTDRHRTPFSTVSTADDAMMAGVLIHAHSLAQLLEGRRPPAVQWWEDFLIVLGCAMLGAALPAFGGSMWLRVGAGGGFLVALWAGAAGLFHYEGVMIGLITPTLSLAAAHWAMEALSGREARKQREFITGAFGRYVSPHVVRSLIDDPTKMSLEGERRIMTFLFTDLANFTPLSEDLESHHLASLVNEYFNGLTDIVLAHDGTICKFEGDAVFLIFNAPLDQPDHPARAVSCALKIDRYAEDFKAKQIAKGVKFGHTRIGVHTGPAVVGNFGSWARFAYTAMGDSVNTAARLEGVNKQFETRICVSDSTKALCPETSFRPLGAVVVKGKTQGILVWEPLQPDDPREAFLEWYGRAFSKLQTMAPDALDTFTALSNAHPKDRTTALHLERLARGERGIEMVLTEK